MVNYLLQIIPANQAHVKTKNGKSAYDIAKEKGHEGVVSLLESFQK